MSLIETLNDTKSFYADILRQESNIGKGAVLGATVSGIAALAFCAYNGVQAVSSTLAGDGSALEKTAMIGVVIPVASLMFTYANGIIGCTFGGLAGAGLDVAYSAAGKLKTALHLDTSV